MQFDGCICLAFKIMNWSDLQIALQILIMVHWITTIKCLDSFQRSTKHRWFLTSYWEIWEAYRLSLIGLYTNNYISHICNWILPFSNQLSRKSRFMIKCSYLVIFWHDIVLNYFCMRRFAKYDLQIIMTFFQLLWVVVKYNKNYSIQD